MYSNTRYNLPLRRNASRRLTMFGCLSERSIFTSRRMVFRTMASSSVSLNFLTATVAPLSRFRHRSTTPYAPSPTTPSTSYLFMAPCPRLAAPPVLRLGVRACGARLLRRAAARPRTRAAARLCVPLAPCSRLPSAPAPPRRRRPCRRATRHPDAGRAQPCRQHEPQRPNATQQPSCVSSRAPVQSPRAMAALLGPRTAGGTRVRPCRGLPWLSAAALGRRAHQHRPRVPFPQQVLALVILPYPPPCSGALMSSALPESPDRGGRVPRLEARVTSNERNYTGKYKRRK